MEATFNTTQLADQFAGRFAESEPFADRFAESAQFADRFAEHNLQINLQVHLLSQSHLQIELQINLQIDLQNKYRAYQLLFLTLMAWCERRISLSLSLRLYTVEIVSFQSALTDEY